MLVIEELDYRHPRVAVIYIIAKARGIDYGQADYSRIRNLLVPM